VLFLADLHQASVPLLTHTHQLVYRLLSLSKASIPIPEILQQLFGIHKYQVPAMSRSELYIDLYDILPITKVVGLTAIMTCNS